jgi:hypothetical protein
MPAGLTPVNQQAMRKIVIFQIFMYDLDTSDASWRARRPPFGAGLPSQIRYIATGVRDIKKTEEEDGRGLPPTDGTRS